MEQGKHGNNGVSSLLFFIIYTFYTNRMYWTGYYELSETSATLYCKYYVFPFHWDFKIEGLTVKNELSLKPDNEDNTVN